MDEQTVSYPEIKLGEITYRIKYRAGDVRRLREAGIDLLGPATAAQGQDALTKTLLMFKHGVAWEHPDPNISEVEDLIDLSEVTVIQIACQEAQLKASARASGVTGPALLRFKAYADQITASIPKEMLDKAKEAQALAESNEKPN